GGASASGGRNMSKAASGALPSRRLRRFGSQKRNTRRWERRVRLCCYRSLRFQVCGLAVVHCALARRIILFLLSSPCSFLLVLFSCSSVDVFKFNRTLCGYASFSVSLR